MKRIYHYLFLLTCLLFVACNDDDNNAEGAYIIKSEVTFEAQGGTGTIEVSTDNLSASSDQDWCKVEAEGNIVKVTVPQNIDIGGRTALITILANNNKLMVPVTQVAPVFIISSTDPLSFFGNDETIELQVQSSLEVKISPEADWIKYEKTGNTIAFHCTKSDVPLRTGQVKIMSGTKTVTLECKQTCIEGEYTFTYTNTDWDDIDLDATLTKDPNEENTFILKGDLPYGRELKLKYENNKLAFHAGQYLGTEIIDEKEYHLFMTLGYGKLTPAWDYVVDYVAPMEQDKKGNYFFEFVDGKHWGKYFATRISISTFTSPTPSESSYVEEIEKMAYVILTIKKVF